MRQTIEQILEGNFDYENGSLDFSCTKLELSLKAGSVHEGAFLINSTPGRQSRGYVTSSDLRMECLTPEFCGVREEIAYRFHAEDLEEGDVVKGEFFVVSNQGEYYLPFVVSIEHTQLTSSIGNIKNLFHFANLAKSNWTEAVSLFYSSDFPLIFHGSDRKYFDSYRGLSVYEGNEQNMEEFLIEIHKKQKVEYSVGEEAITLENPYGVAETELTLARNGWGYTRLKVETEGDFVFVEKEFITDDDFLGNLCRLPVYVDSSLLHGGKNFGRIRLFNSYVSLTVPVTVRVVGAGRAGNAGRQKKKLLVRLMESYQAFRLKKISSAVWLKETGRLVERMVALDERDISARLFQAQLLITGERNNEALWILDHAAQLIQRQDNRNMELWAYYLYLTTLVRRDAAYVDQVTEEVEMIYRSDRSSWRVAWLLLYLSEDYNRSGTGRWMFLEKQFQYGCSSPVIYIETLLLLNSNPALLRRLGEFELQVLEFGARREMLTEEVQEQLLYLAGRMKEYSAVLLHILEKCYRRKQDTRVLGEICALLMKGDRTDGKCFPWYRLGVEHGLRLTKLYECYMMSLDLEEDQELPKMVLMYFSYQNNLDYERSAYLYCCVLRKKEEYQELYLTYRERIERFVLEQIGRERINRHLAYLYQEVLTPEMISARTAPALSRLLFAHLVRIDTPQIRKIIVYQPGSRSEAVYPVQDAGPWVALYGNDCAVLFEDGERNRFISSVSYTLERLFLPHHLLRAVATFVQDNQSLDLYLCGEGQELYEYADDNAQRCLRVVDSGDVFPEVKREICIRALDYFYDNDDMRRLDGFLEQLPDAELTGRERGEILRYMVLRGKYELGFQWLVRYGPYDADAKTLVRIVSEIMQRQELVEMPVLTGAAVHAFRKGKYDGNVLHYLALYFRGLTRELRDIWKAAVSFDVPCYELCERMLIQMLYTGSFVGEKMDVFRSYVAKGARQQVEEAFLAQCSYDYFVKEKLTDSFVFEEIRYMRQRQEPVQRICRLAFLKYYAENREEIKEAVRPLIREFLEEAVAQGHHLNFMRQYREYESLLYPILDKTIIEYRAHPASRTCMHYVIVHENGETEDYLTEDMHMVYGGVCFKEFVLFFGESLQYYIVESREGGEQLTESGTVQKSDMGSRPENSRYELVNDIVISNALQDYDTLDCLLEEYCRKEYMNGRLFALI